MGGVSLDAMMQFSMSVACSGGIAASDEIAGRSSPLSKRSRASMVIRVSSCSHSLISFSGAGSGWGRVGGFMLCLWFGWWVIVGFRFRWW